MPNSPPPLEPQGAYPMLAHGAWLTRAQLVGMMGSFQADAYIQAVWGLPGWRNNYQGLTYVWVQWVFVHATDYPDSTTLRGRLRQRLTLIPTRAALQVSNAGTRAAGMTWLNQDAPSSAVHWQ